MASRFFFALPVFLKAAADGDVSDNGANFSGIDLASTGRLLAGIVIFVIIMYVMYLVVKFLLPGRNLRKTGNLKVIEAIAVGQGSSVQVVRASGEYFLIGVTKTHVTFLARLDEAATGDTEAGTAKVIPFEKHLARFFGVKNAEKNENAAPGEENGTDKGGADDD